MKRELDINEISDGEKYTNDHMVRISCNDCEGCHKCCCDMDKSIILDPYDIFLLTKNLNREFQTFIGNEIELNIVDGITLPNIKMSDAKNSCSFLNQEGRCSIHNFRPGLCRLFPLARIYENDSFFYIHQIYECDHPAKTKVKIKKWLGIDNIKEYEKYINTYRYFIIRMEDFVNTCNNEGQIKTLNLLILRTFFMEPYSIDNDFYSQFYERLRTIKNILNID